MVNNACVILCEKQGWYQEHSDEGNCTYTSEKKLMIFSRRAGVYLQGKRGNCPPNEKFCKVLLPVSSTINLVIYIKYGFCPQSAGTGRFCPPRHGLQLRSCRRVASFNKLQQGLFTLCNLYKTRNIIIFIASVNAYLDGRNMLGET